MISRTNDSAVTDRWRRRAPEPPAQSVNIQDLLHEHKGTVTQILQQRSVWVSPLPIRQAEASVKRMLIHVVAPTSKYFYLILGARFNIQVYD